MLTDSNKAKLLVILEALQIFSVFFYGRFVVESDFANVVSWVSKSATNP